MYKLLLGAILAMMLPLGLSYGNVSTYQFLDTYGDQISPEGTPTEILSAGADDGVAGFTPSVAKGEPAFTFYFDNKPYTRFSATSNGLVGFGSTDVTRDYENDLGSPTVPHVAPFWDDQLILSDKETGLGDGNVRYFLNGTAPNRVLVIEFNNMQINWEAYAYYGYVIPGFYQVRLYESSNRIEFWYGDFYYTEGFGTTASIGIATGSSDFISVTPGDGYGGGGSNAKSGGAGLQGVTGATFSTSTVNNDVDLESNPLYYGTLYVFNPCNIQITGDPSQGGTSAMANNDKLLSGTKIQVWTSQGYQPFSLYLDPDPCSSRAYTFTISGANPGDFIISPTNGKIGADSKVTPTVTFAPTAIGMRTATLQVTDDNGFDRTYMLEAEATPRLIYIGNVASGGTATVKSGDTLMNGLKVTRLAWQDFMPLTISNTNNNGKAPSAPVTFTLVDASGQYKLINPSNGQLVNSLSTPLSALGASTPAIRFAPKGVGPQRATLTVNAEGEIRSYVLYAYSAAAGGDFYLGGTRKLGPNEDVFNKDFICAGEYIQSYPITVVNVGEGEFQILGTRVYQTDSIYGQGNPAYPLLRDENWMPIPSVDYFISTEPGVAPVPANGMVDYPISVPEKGSSTIYVNFVAQHPGKRFARIYVATNGANFTGVNPETGYTEDGLLTFDLFGRGLGSSISDRVEGGQLPKPVKFANTPIRTTKMMTVTLYNPGACDLRVSKDRFRISSGDVKEFKIVDAFSNLVLDGNSNTYMMAPGDSTTVTLQFTPSRSGTRRATIELQTNDSTIILPGLTERGSYYWDVTGVGTVGLEPRDVMFAPAVIGGATSDQSVASAMVENTTQELIFVNKVEIVGTDAAEFAMNPAKPWPAVPFAVMPGGVMNLSVVHTPAPASQPGPRSAQLNLTLSNGDVVTLNLIGEAGTRTLAASPASLFDNVSVPVGKVARQTVMITNSGTMPVKLSTTTITGPTSTDYTLGRLPRTTLAPGQSEFLEVTYRPLNKGTSSATLTVNTNATNGAQVVQLGGTATRIQPGTGEANGTSSVDATLGTNGTTLWQTAPNPGRDLVKLAYRIADAGSVSVKLYNEQGKEVMTLDEGTRDAGDHSVSF
ncbi:MAG: choice-of-anchor D domain-containing protein, partial [Armatimonadetes bacterium]|nr:choice-of-anchor D domain-containing protein [Armatimonadota bacterium]